jgi:sucrose phosphorylase
MSTDIQSYIKENLGVIYSTEVAKYVFEDLRALMDHYRSSEIIQGKRKKYKSKVFFDEKDAFLITYPDTIRSRTDKPLAILHRFLKEYVGNAVSGVHILPFFPSSSDGGFAVIDFTEVDPAFGTWEDIRTIAKEYRLMVGLVMNHVSSRSKWFQSFLDGDGRYKNYFIWRKNRLEMPEVFRPREIPLFTPFQTAMGKRYVWTTFGPDQIDLNYREPEVLLRMIQALLFYLSHGAEIIRLDAVGYIWKEPGTSCVNLAKTHQFVKLLRRVLEYVAPYAAILTEANFPYKDNIAYFGEGHEANLVYRFSLPALVIDAFSRQDTSYIRDTTNRTRQELLFFDFLASHDGISLMSAREILKPDHFHSLLQLVQSHNGFVSYRKAGNQKEPYELNINFFDAINNPNEPEDPMAVRRYMASQAIMLALKGIPGIYVHSMLGSRNNDEGARQSGDPRMINREKLNLEKLVDELSNNKSLRRQVLDEFLILLRAKNRIRAFHPRGERKVIESDKRLLVIERSYRGERVTAFINVSGDTLTLPACSGRKNEITGEYFNGKIDPYGIYFLV